jgi:hypothetical protein
MDIAVKDPRSTTTGWVFATYDYDSTLTSSEPNAWKRLTPVGMMWGDDPTVNANGQPLTETWINPALPAALSHPGLNGRLIGPVDNAKSSCISCHSTAQIDRGVVVSSGAPASAFTGAATIIPAACTTAQRANWLRDLASGSAFGVTDANGTGCNIVATPTGTTLYSLDNSLQLEVGLESALYRANTNPCVGKTPGQNEAPQSASEKKKPKRASGAKPIPVRLDDATTRKLTAAPPAPARR